ncbi:rap guanine nucleotide exchange factor-like 1, partial [Etheostoma spectabile]|uniref:rap guanine nucleotide exchange factor-like 1 n=1 Tax=Etheostoma spectabile TaxID=54343 RepID=UPI0013AF8910
MQMSLHHAGGDEAAGEVPEEADHGADPGRGVCWGGGGQGQRGVGASRRRASLSRVVPFFRETSPEGGQAREVFSPDSEDPPSWPSATGPGVIPAPGSANSSGDIRSPSLSSDEQSSEASLITESGGGGSGGGTPLPPDTPDNLTLALLDSAAGRRPGVCTETLLDDFMLTHPIFLAADRFQQVLLQQFSLRTERREGGRAGGAGGGAGGGGEGARDGGGR